MSGLLAFGLEYAVFGLLKIFGTFWARCTMSRLLEPSGPDAQPCLCTGPINSPAHKALHQEGREVQQVVTTPMFISVPTSTVCVWRVAGGVKK